MKLITILSAGALAIGTLAVTPAPADAQRHGYRGDHGSYRGHYYAQRGYYRSPRYAYRGDHYRPGQRYGYRGYGRSRVVCRIHHGRYGPVRRCY